MIVASMSALAVDEPTPKDANTIYNPVFVAADYLTTEGGTVAMTAAYADAVAKNICSGRPYPLRTHFVASELFLVWSFLRLLLQ